MAIRNIPEVPGYIAPQLGNVFLTSDSLISEVGQLTLNDPTLYRPALITSAWASSGSGSTYFQSSYDYPYGNPYGIKGTNGNKRIFLPNIAVLETMPIGSTVQLTDSYTVNGVGSAPITQTFTTTGLYDGHSFTISQNPSNTTTASGGYHNFSISWTGTQPSVGIDPYSLRLLHLNAAGSVHQQLKNKRIHLVSFYERAEKWINISTSWEVPENVYSLDVTLIGGGGNGGVVTATASTHNCSTNTYATQGNGYGEDSTITYNGVTYTAKGGQEGVGGTGTATESDWYWLTNSSTETYTNFPVDSPGSNNPGKGGVGGYARASAKSSGWNSDFTQLFSIRALAQGYSKNGDDGEVRHFTIPVEPYTTVDIVAGQNGGDGGTWNKASSNPGAVYIRYVQ